MIERRVLVLPGDNIGSEIVPEAIKVLTKVDEIFDLNIEFEYGELGGAAIDAFGHPCPNATLEKAKAAIEKVSRAQGYDYILDASQGSGLIVSDGKDLKADVKKELGF